MKRDALKESLKEAVAREMLLKRVLKRQELERCSSRES
jgi:hypothetical protein